MVEWETVDLLISVQLRDGAPKKEKKMKKSLPLTTNTIGNGIDTFCAECFTHESFFVGGQSATPDICPCGCEDTVNWGEYSDKVRHLLQMIYYRDCTIAEHCK